MELAANSSGRGPLTQRTSEAGTVTWVEQARAIFLKDLRAESRTKVAFSAIGVFTLSSLLLMALATATLKELKAFSEPRFYQAFDRLHSSSDVAVKSIVDAALFPAWSDSSKMAILWVLLCFAAFAGLSHAFVHEEEAGTTLALRLTMSAPAVYAGKLMFNLMLIAVVTVVITPAFMLVTGMHVGSPLVFAGTMFSGCVGLAGSATIIAALAAKAHGTGALYGALGLPLLVVFIALLMNAANTVYAPQVGVVQALKDVGGLISYGVALIGVSSITFRYVWEE